MGAKVDWKIEMGKWEAKASKTRVTETLMV